MRRSSIEEPPRDSLSRREELDRRRNPNRKETTKQKGDTVGTESQPAPGAATLFPRACLRVPGLPTGSRGHNRRGMSQAPNDFQIMGSVTRR
ncbi:hypothetical protein RRG08_032950 [Elysia crispata]|uniref:Uncharacterized protein n=1 Tax=Elysia crispata TaxID=231223 RepID=A0AAE0YTQ0_9GAST|nr:hypothetical protein RRG08_032950 [Elysia crispata]